jgi:hypothetical protein
MAGLHRHMPWSDCFGGLSRLVARMPQTTGHCMDIALRPAKRNGLFRDVRPLKIRADPKAIIFLYLVSRARRQGKIRKWKEKNNNFFLGFRGPAAVQNRPK